MEEISLKEIFGIIRERLELIIIITLAITLITGLVSAFLIEEQYQTFTTLIVGRSNDSKSMEDDLDYNDLLMSQKLVSTYGELVKMRAVSDKVIDNLKLDMTYKELGDKLSVNLVKDTEIIKLEVKDTDPERATEIANETAIVFIDTVKDVMNIENVRVIDKAQVPTKPVSPRVKLNIAIGFVLGVMLSIFIVFLIEYLDTSIKTPEELESFLGLSVIGAIPLVENIDDDGGKK